jgi:hypothetical protein
MISPSVSERHHPAPRTDQESEAASYEAETLRGKRKDRSAAALFVRFIRPRHVAVNEEAPSAARNLPGSASPARL